MLVASAQRACGGKRQTQSKPVLAEIEPHFQATSCQQHVHHTSTSLTRSLPHAIFPTPLLTEQMAAWCRC